MGEACQMQPTFAHRLRYSEKLIEAARFADAEDATQIGQSADSQRRRAGQVLEQDIKLHMAAGDISTVIEKLEMETAQSELENRCWRGSVWLSTRKPTARLKQPLVRSAKRSSSLRSQRGS